MVQEESVPYSSGEYRTEAAFNWVFERSQQIDRIYLARIYAEPRESGGREPEDIGGLNGIVVQTTNRH
jgi:hypothetical protein